MNELFIIPPQTVRTYDSQVIDETIEGLRSLDLCRLPYPKVDIQIAVETPKQLKFPAGSPQEVVEACLDGRAPWLEIATEPTCMALRMIGVRADGEYDKALIDVSAPDYRPATFEIPKTTMVGGPEGNMTGAVGLTVRFLIVLLATRNAVKRTEVHKLAKLGIGRRRPPAERYARVTTIDVPKELPHDTDHPPTGRTVAPHLRRGHVRRQHYGPHNAFVRSQWIEPTFVNADPDFVSTRKAYNLSL